MKNVKTAGQLIAALAISAACAMPALAQNTGSDTAATNNMSTPATTTVRTDEDHRDYGWS